MKVQYGKEMANHSGPESCGRAREGATEALTGETGRSGIEPRNQESGTSTLLSEAKATRSRVLIASPVTVLRGRRPAHAGKSIARKLGDLHRAGATRARRDREGGMP